MNKLTSSLLLFLFSLCPLMASAENWPDGTKMDKWFSDTTKVSMASLGKQYVITDYGVKNDPNLLQTEAIQQVIDKRVGA